MKKKRCGVRGCRENRQPYFGYEDCDWERCKLHKLSDMIRLDAQCEHPNCQYLPEWGLKGGHGRVCEMHRTARMERKKGCLAAGCALPRVYGYFDGVTQFCGNHKADGMVAGGAEGDGEEEEMELAAKLGEQNNSQETAGRDAGPVVPCQDKEGEAEVQLASVKLEPKLPAEQPPTSGKTEEESRFEDRGEAGLPLETMLNKDLPRKGTIQIKVEEAPTAVDNLSLKAIASEKATLAGLPQTSALAPSRPKKRKRQQDKGASLAEPPTETKTILPPRYIPPKQCLNEECSRSALFGFENQGVMYCSSHRVQGMVFKRRSERLMEAWEAPQQDTGCGVVGCNNSAWYGYEGMPASYCFVHKLDGMKFQAALVLKDAPNSENIPDSSKKKSTQGLSCLKSDNDFCPNKVTDEDLSELSPNFKKSSKLCEEDSCDKPSWFGWLNELPCVCSRHRQDDMYYWFSFDKSYKRNEKPKCHFIDCARYPTYGLPESQTLQFCKLHKVQGMTYMGKKSAKKPVPEDASRISKLCQFENGKCLKRARFSSPKDGDPKFCSEHKQEDMVCVIRLKKRPGRKTIAGLGSKDHGGEGYECEASNCSNNAVLGNGGEMLQFCALHKQENAQPSETVKPKPRKGFLCQEPNCQKRATFALESSFHHPIFCSSHKSEGMVSVTELRPEIRCKTEGCRKAGNYGYYNDLRIACIGHKTADMISRKAVINMRQSMKKTKKKSCCEEEGCSKRATFGFIGEALRMCSDHRVDGMFWCGRKPIGKRKCKMNDCIRVPMYGYENGKREYCGKHRKDGMLLHCKKSDKKFCAEENCENEPIYGFPHKKRGPRYCNLHKKDGMTLPNDLCKHDGAECSQKAYYGYKEAPHLRCKDHKIPGMLCFKPKPLMKQCKFEGCTTVPSYGDDQDTRAFCVLHKRPGMIHCDKRKSCENVDCNRHPYYGFPNGKTRFCSLHKLEGMQARHGRKRCEFDGCTKGPAYGFQGKVRQFCSLHKMPGMTRTSVCQYGECKKYPHYGNPGQPIREYCEDHRFDWMVYHPKKTKSTTGQHNTPFGVISKPLRRGRPSLQQLRLLHEKQQQGGFTIPRDNVHENTLHQTSNHTYHSAHHVVDKHEMHSSQKSNNVHPSQIKIRL